MPVFKLHTNEGTRFVHSTQERLRKAMVIYIKDKREKGYKLSEIMFCWSPLQIGRI